ncbi:F0F1 ATP synthase subunit B [Sciscionella marina]|uniref:F0F1 ATP synthase subunit B n=1 Tax=Sciscionella marina TaxID=508770 RepID=UPI0003A43362|nr:F0F1 ATP synthase subunit B [Sciscionella marina]
MDAAQIGEIIAFVLMIIVIWWKVVPPVKKMMTKQKDAIAHQISESEKAKEALAEAERKHADAVNEARVEAAKIRDNARADAQRITEEMQAQAESEVTRIKQRGEEQLAMLRQQTLRQLRGELGLDSHQGAEQLVRAHLADPAKQQASVDRFIEELEGMASKPERASVGGEA